jgi:orotate phosphoribosyltransferase-like protein
MSDKIPREEDIRQPGDPGDGNSANRVIVTKPREWIPLAEVARKLNLSTEGLMYRLKRAGKVTAMKRSDEPGRPWLLPGTLAGELYAGFTVTQPTAVDQGAVFGRTLRTIAKQANAAKAYKATAPVVLSTKQATDQINTLKYQISHKIERLQIALDVLNELG